MIRSIGQANLKIIALAKFKCVEKSALDFLTISQFLKKNKKSKI